MNNKVDVIADAKTLKDLYDNSACTMLGYMPEELYLYINELQEEGFLKDDFVVYGCEGKAMNEAFELEGQNRFPEDLHIFMLDLDDMKNLSKFAVTLRFARGYRWLDDIINNSR